jgi:CRISPR/Cas system CMR subunit Cmr4 (Cas7 group RAMP superfamily)
MLLPKFKESKADNHCFTSMVELPHTASLVERCKRMRVDRRATTVTQGAAVPQEAAEPPEAADLPEAA